jgi:hypothetical protein
MRLATLLVLMLPACGDNASSRVDAAALDARHVDAPALPPLCHATFTGNFALDEDVPANCGAMSGSGSLTFDLPVLPIDADLTIEFQLANPPSTGQFSSESGAQWSAVATQHIGNSVCSYVAGSTSVPPGDFTLKLASIDSTSAHGSLMLDLAVLPGSETSCGTQNYESLELSF